MLREIYNNIAAGQDVRKNLIELRKLLKDKNNKLAFQYFLGGDYEVLKNLLTDEDAKTRKNVALIMGEIKAPEFRSKLYTAYENEEKLFIKVDYLEALKQFEYSDLADKLKARLDYLTTGEFEETSMKHINEEIRTLTEMLLTVEKPRMHKFTGYNVLSDVVLLTNRDHKDVTLEQITNGKAKEFNAGVIARTKDLNEILNIRTYTELLFRLKNVGTVAMEPAIIAEALCSGGLLEFLDERHEGSGAYYFRIEVKSKMLLDKKSDFTKKLAAKLEQQSGRKLINSTSNYEFEIRLIEGRDGVFNVLLKLYTIKDERFAYRKHAVAASISPVTAALVARLAKPYLVENAQVLDPFCGVGTMLIERNKLVPATPMYGIDSFGQAIDKAIINAREAKAQINFINRDFFDFKHDYLFDEIFTNMPAQTGRKSEDELMMLYHDFFNKALEVLKDEAVIIMYTRNKEMVEREVRAREQYEVLKKFEISKKENAYVYILSVNQ
nr:methyltransferase domain-containing protein [uncultured Cellulosilyticum sp.]